MSLLDDDYPERFARGRLPADADAEQVAEYLAMLRRAARWRLTQVEHRRCSECDRSLPTSAFRVQASSPSGFASQCRACRG